MILTLITILFLITLGFIYFLLGKDKTIHILERLVTNWKNGGRTLFWSVVSYFVIVFFNAVVNVGIDQHSNSLLLKYSTRFFLSFVANYFLISSIHAWQDGYDLPFKSYFTPNSPLVLGSTIGAVISLIIHALIK